MTAADDAVHVSKYRDLFRLYSDPAFARTRHDPAFTSRTASKTNDKATTRLVGEKQAAEGLGLPLATFRNWVASGRLPRALPEIDKWDTKALDAALDRISGVGSATNALDAWRERKRG